MSSNPDKTIESRVDILEKEALLRSRAKFLMLDIRAFKDGCSVRKEVNHPLLGLTQASRKMLYKRVAGLSRKTGNEIGIERMKISFIYDNLQYFLDMLGEIQAKIPELYAKINQLKSPKKK